MCLKGVHKRNDCLWERGALPGQLNNAFVGLIFNVKTVGNNF